MTTTGAIDRFGTLTLHLAGRLHPGGLLRELTLDPTKDYQPSGKDRYAKRRPLRVRKFPIS